RFLRCGAADREEYAEGRDRREIREAAVRLNQLRWIFGIGQNPGISTRSAIREVRRSARRPIAEEIVRAREPAQLRIHAVVLDLSAEVDLSQAERSKAVRYQIGLKFQVEGRCPRAHVERIRIETVGKGPKCFLGIAVDLDPTIQEV